MDPSNRVNILLRTFPGLSLPPTVSFSLPSTTTTANLLNRVAILLPPSLSSHLTLTTTSNHTILPSTIPISTLLPPTTSHGYSLPSSLLPLALTAPLSGGKGGFGSQLRAAGGRMSSRKRKNALASDPNAGIGSNRNLDGRRLRTITEAKNLAGYLAAKPEVERKEKEEKRRRWEAVVEGAERREEEIRRGLAGGGRGKGLSEEWLEEREDAGERTREAVRRAMAGGAGAWRDSIAGRGSGEGSRGASAGASGSDASRDPSVEDSEDEEAMDLDEEEVTTLEKEAAAGDVDAIWVLKNKVKKTPIEKEERSYIGFDEDDEFVSSSDEEEAAVISEGKGKQKRAALG